MFSLDNLFPERIPYPIRGALIRGIRVFIAGIVAAVGVSLADGSLIAAIAIIPAAWAPVIVLAGTTVLTAVDKWLRERGLETVTDPVVPPSTDVVG